MGCCGVLWGAVGCCGVIKLQTLQRLQDRAPRFDTPAVAPIHSLTWSSILLLMRSTSVENVVKRIFSESTLRVLLTVKHAESQNHEKTKLFLELFQSIYFSVKLKLESCTNKLYRGHSDAIKTRYLAQ